MSLSLFKLVFRLALSATAVFSSLTFGAAQAQNLPIEGVPYTIEARHSGQFLDVIGRSQSENARISQWPRQEKDGVQQIWIFEHVAGQEANVFRIKSNYSQRYLTAATGWIGYGGTGRAIIQRKLNATGEQDWCLEATTESYFRIRSCDPVILRDFRPVFLDAIGTNMSKDARLGLYVETTPGLQQQWKPMPVKPIISKSTVVGRPVLKWKWFCQVKCNVETTEEIVTVNGTESTISNETKTSITNAIAVGVEYSGVSVEASHSQTNESSSSASESKSFSRSMGKSRKDTIKFDTDTLNIFTVWAWVAVAQMSDGTEMIINSGQYSCRPDAVAPTYLPGSAEDIKSCHIPR